VSLRFDQHIGVKLPGNLTEHARAAALQVFVLLVSQPLTGHDRRDDLDLAIGAEPICQNSFHRLIVDALGAGLVILARLQICIVAMERRPIDGEDLTLEGTVDEHKDPGTAYPAIGIYKCPLFGKMLAYQGRVVKRGGRKIIRPLRRQRLFRQRITVRDALVRARHAHARRRGTSILATDAEGQSEQTNHHEESIALHTGLLQTRSPPGAALLRLAG
jgi:hypothetical protein